MGNLKVGPRVFPAVCSSSSSQITMICSLEGCTVCAIWKQRFCYSSMMLRSCRETWSNNFFPKWVSQSSQVMQQRSQWYVSGSVPTVPNGLSPYSAMGREVIEARVNRQRQKKVRLGRWAGFMFYSCSNNTWGGTAFCKADENSIEV